MPHIPSFFFWLRLVSLSLSRVSKDNTKIISLGSSLSRRTTMPSMRFLMGLEESVGVMMFVQAGGGGRRIGASQMIRGQYFWFLFVCEASRR